MNPGVLIGINAGVTFLTAFGAALAAGAGWKTAVGAGLAALVGNQVGLYQNPPLKPRG